MKKLATSCTVAVLALILSGCGGSEESSSTSTSAGPEGLVNEGKLTACIDPEYAPLEYYENGSDGEIVGFDADGIRALADHWGVEATMNVTSFDGLMPQLQSGSCDMIYGGLYMSEERLAIADASPVMNAGPTILTTPDEAGSLAATTDLCGLTVAAQAASANAISINKVSQTCVSEGMDAVKVDEYPKTAETVLAVLNGKADALVETNVAAAYMVTQNEGKLAEAGDIFELDTTFGVFSRKDDALSPAIAEGLKALQADGTMAEIAEKYNLDPSITDVD